MSVNSEEEVIDTGFEELNYEGAKISCASKGCTQDIESGEPCFLDHRQLNPTGRNTYCQYCGPCLRYARKHAMRRGEALPIPGAVD